MDCRDQEIDRRTRDEKGAVKTETIHIPGGSTG